MFRLSNTPTVAVGDDEIAADADEPPDHVPEVQQLTANNQKYTRAAILPPNNRRESLLTRAITTGAQSTDAIPPSIPVVSRALSTASSQSIPSTADLTSDGELTSPVRSVSPSPPAPATRLLPIREKVMVDARITTPAIIADVKADHAVSGEAAVEKTLGRKRCIMFACSEKPKAVDPPKEPSVPLPARTETQAEPQPRKCRLTFACPTRQDSNNSTNSKASKPHLEDSKCLSSSPPPKSVIVQPKPEFVAISDVNKSAPSSSSKPVPSPIAKPSQPFHEFGSSQDETDSWVNSKSVEVKPKLTLQDVMKKENAIRKIGEEAEEEADEEQWDQDELDEDLDEENEVEDDFAPSDEDEDEDDSDDGNESDDEGGFAESDEESDAGSEYRFWAPATTTAATSAENLTHFSLRQRSRSSSLDSAPSQATSPRANKMFHPRRASKSRAIKMRPGTPELPDSTDFVCGTLDEDRPLEAAFISCREQKKREKHILIPQDIDPSFPTTDPEDDDEEEVVDEDESEPVWLRDQFGAMDDDAHGKRRQSAIRITPVQVVPQIHQPKPVRPAPAAPVRRSTNRSPPPTRHRSPPPRRLFGQSPSRMRSPPPNCRYRSPRGSPANMKMPLGITINRLAQRPGTDRTASLPHTPNPFFRNWKRGSPPTSRIPSGAVSPGSDEAVRSSLHVRGPVDIVIGLEKKRQKRKEKFFRQHCRKAAKEHSERKPVPGRGVERMKELGLECAERTRGYGLGQQQAKLVLSL